MFLHELWCQMPNASLKSKSCIISGFFSGCPLFLFYFKWICWLFWYLWLHWKSGKFVIFRSTSSFKFFISYICFCWLMFCYRIRLSLKEKEDLTNDWINLNHFSLICIPQCHLSESCYWFCISFWIILFLVSLSWGFSFILYRHCHSCEFATFELEKM